MSNKRIEGYQALPRNDLGHIGVTDYKPKTSKVTLDSVLAEPKPKFLSYFERRKP